MPDPVKGDARSGALDFQDSREVLSYDVSADFMKVFMKHYTREDDSVDGGFHSLIW